MAGVGIGMMDPAFFVGRRAIIDWLNSSFLLNLSKIEETASGAVACQILDSIWPGEMPMSRVRWDARSPHEFIENYKLLQAMLEKKGVDKHIEVRRRGLGGAAANARAHARSGLTQPRARPPLRRSLAPPQVDKLMRAKYQDNLENMQWRVGRTGARVMRADA